MKVAIIVLGLMFITSFAHADKYAIKLIDGKLAEYQKLSDKYLAEHASDPTSPIQQGYILVDSIEGFELYVPPAPPTDKEKFLDMLDDESIKLKIKDIIK